MTSGMTLALTLLAATSVLALGAAATGVGGVGWGDNWSMMDGDPAGHMADHDEHMADHDAMSAEECEAGEEAHAAHMAEQDHCEG